MQQLAKLEPLKLDLGDGCVINMSTEVKNLGVIFDQNLNFKSQVASVSRSSYYHLYNIQKARSSLTYPACEAAIHSFVHSKLDYSNALYYGLPNSTLYSLQKVQNSAARTLTGTNRREHITPVLKSLHWLNVKCRCKYKILTVMYKVHIGVAPPYISNLVQRYEPSRTLRSGNQITFVEIPTSLKYGGDRAFCKCGPVLWNCLPSQLRSATSLTAFKRKLKTHLFVEEYGH